MANTLSALFPTIFARVLPVLRNQNTVPRATMFDLRREAAQQGDTIKVPITSVTTTETMSMGTPTSGETVNPTTRDLVLNQYRRAKPIAVTDKEWREIENPSSFFTAQFTESVSALCDEATKYVFECIRNRAYQTVGTAGTTPFSSNIKVATTATKLLTKAKAGMVAADRAIVVNPDAYENAINLAPVQRANERGEMGALRTGMVGSILGATWYQDNQVVDQTAGSGTVQINKSGGHAVGDATLTVDGSGTVNVGDIVTIGSHTYVATTEKDATTTTLGIYPGLRAAAADNVTLTQSANHAVNLAFHRNAVAFASRPLSPPPLGSGRMVMSEMDPQSGLSLNMEVEGVTGGTWVTFSILYGCLVVRPDHCIRIFG